MDTKIQTITPEMANKMLEKSTTHNRNFNKNNLANLVKQIVAGHWKFNGQPIILDRNGNIQDGHHRLKAVTIAKIPIVTLIVTLDDPTAISTMDTGRARNRADILTFTGQYKNTGKLAVTARLVWLAENNKLKDILRGDHDTQMSSAELLDLLQRHPRLQEVLHTGMSCHLKFKPITVSLFTFLAYWLPRYDSEKAEEFVQKLASGTNLSDNSPILQLRKRLIQETTGRAKINMYVKMALIIKAWRFHALGIPCGLLRLNLSESFPDIDPTN